LYPKKRLESFTLLPEKKNFVLFINLNYLSLIQKEFLFRAGAFIVGWALFYQFYDLPKTYDW